jgi:hypothetical protein
MPPAHPAGPGRGQVNDPADPAPVTDPPQRGRIDGIGLHGHHHVTQIGERGRVGHQAPGGGQAPLAEVGQGADGMRADKAEPASHQDHAHLPISQCLLAGAAPARLTRARH